MPLFGSSSNHPVLVLGASGMIGSEVVRQLVAKNVPVIALARDLTKLQTKLAVQHEHLFLVRGDFNAPDTIQHAALNGTAEKAFLHSEGCNSGVLNALKSGGVKHIVYVSTSYIGLPTPPMALQQWQTAHEEAIKNAGFTYTMLRAEAFMSNAFRWKDSIAHGVVKTTHADAPIPVVAIEDIASTAVTAFTGHSLDNMVVTIIGPQSITSRQQVAVISQVLGKPIKVIEQSEEVFKNENKQHVPEPVLDSMFLYQRMRIERGANLQVKTDKLVTGQVTFQQFIEKHKAEFIAAAL